MTSTSLSSQAKLLARHLKKQGLATLTQSQALEAVAHALNFSSFNTAKAHEERQESSRSAKEARAYALELLAQAHREGLTQADVIGFFASLRTPSDLALVEAAKGYHDEGELEVDDTALVSVADRTSGSNGAYVQAWRWVWLSEIKVPSDILDALSLPYESLVLRTDEEDFSVEFESAEFNEQAIGQLRKGVSLPENTWLVRQRGKKPILEVKHYRALTFNESGECWEGKIDGAEMLLEFCST